MNKSGDFHLNQIIKNAKNDAVVETFTKTFLHFHN